ncbi:MAG TPA: dienelactone hydrolase family protein [Actinophytocola sp.]|uniref:dienelactone hydrolase family protein n=1 Tax=Actinophytocola sp. TaxID=1872138 RepID=UPI002DDD94E5|nr:dienelactone hydrolase family protein [Actinophytocola sp.]HEV2779307.1 dienelactone hydrolase family protein [Actinophytocola sp.]
MCHADESRPPAPPVSTGVAESGETRLTSADGTRFGAYAARPARPNGRGVVILPDIRGLHAFYRVLADLFADAGFDAVAFDYFGRTAETDERGESFDHRPHVPKVTPEHVELDVAASIAYLRSLPNPAEHLFTVGFCFGGAASWRQSAHGHGIAGAIGFYGGRPLERVGPWVPRMTAPLLMLLAGVDSTTPEEFDEFADLVRANGIEVESHTYPGAPHSFFDRSYADHRAACADAWERILDFTARRSGA